MKTWAEFLAEMELKPVKKVIPNPNVSLLPVFKAQGPSAVVRPLTPLSKKLGNKNPTPRGSAHIKSD